MKKINLLISILAVVSALSMACGDTGSERSAGADSGQEAISQEEEKEENGEEKARDDSEQADKEEEFKQQCQSVDYREYFRNDQKYIGEKIKVELLVDQVIEGDCRGYDLSDNEYYYIVRQITGPNTQNVFSSVQVKKRRRSGATLRLFDLCNRENKQVTWGSYLRNDVLYQ